MQTSSLTVPKSVAHWTDPWTIALLIIAIYLGLRDTEATTTQISIVMCLGLTVFTGLLELFRASWRQTPRPIVPFRDVLNSAFVKWVGSMTGLAIMLFGWWFLREYDKKQYLPLFDVLPYALPFVPLVMFITHLYTEWRLGPSGGDGKDLGLVTLLQWKKVDGKGVADELLNWFIKGFFFSINFCELPKAMAIIRGREEEIFNLPWHQLQPLIILIIYAFIIASILPGYLFSSRLFNTHARRIANSWFAYTVTLVCYSPFVMGLTQRWFNYHPINPSPDWNKPWVSFFNDDMTVLYILGGIIILSELVHYWGEAIIGIRSSNLTHRGLITNGPFRYCKHPVYTSKCISWFIMWLPFMNGDTALECARLTFAYFGMCVVFGARSWAEERILAEDPDYVAYALWVDQHGMFAPISRFIPLLQFRWRLKRWIRRGEVNADVVPAGYVL